MRTSKVEVGAMKIFRLILQGIGALTILLFLIVAGWFWLNSPYSPKQPKSRDDVIFILNGQVSIISKILRS